MLRVLERPATTEVNLHWLGKGRGPNSALVLAGHEPSRPKILAVETMTGPTNTAITTGGTPRLLGYPGPMPAGHFESPKEWAALWAAWRT
jgi:hypothetical protein